MESTLQKSRKNKRFTNRRILISTIGITFLGTLGYKLNLFVILPKNIKNLYDPQFKNSLKGISTQDIISRLKELKLFKNESLIYENTSSPIYSEKLIYFNNYWYSEAELYLYTYVARLKNIGFK